MTHIHTHTHTRRQNSFKIFQQLQTHTHAQLNVNVYDVISTLLCYGGKVSGHSNVNCHSGSLWLLLFVVSDKFGLLSYVKNDVNMGLALRASTAWSASGNIKLI